MTRFRGLVLGPVALSIIANTEIERHFPESLSDKRVGSHQPVVRQGEKPGGYQLRKSLGAPKPEEKNPLPTLE